MTDSHGIRTLPQEDSEPFDPVSDDRYEMVPLARAALWAGLAAFAAFVAVIAARSDLGGQRIAGLFGTAERSAPAATPRPGGPDSAMAAQLLNLTERVKSLESERERLVARLAAVEKHLDITASVNTAPAVPRVTSDTRTEPAARTDFAIDLGPAPNVEALRALWTTIRTQSGDLLSGLQPLAAIRDTPSGLELRLVAGPTANAAEAARLCASIAATGRGCKAAAFEGQRIALP